MLNRFFISRYSEKATWMQSTSVFIFIIFTFFMSSFLKAEDLLTTNIQQKYGIEDLNYLEKEKNFEEFFNHALDIRPSKRNKLWKSMTNGMAELYFKKLEQKRKITKEEFLKVEKLIKWPVLKSNEYLFIKRAQIAQTYFLKCFKENKQKNNYCSEKIFDYWTTSTYKDSQHAITLANYINKYNPKFNTDFLIRYTTSSYDSEFLCQNPLVKKYLYSNISNLLINIDDDNILKKKLNKLFNEKCWSVLKKDLIHNTINGDRNLKLMSFKVLNLKNSLSRINKDLFYIDYLMDTPIKSDLLNNAWSRIEVLRNHPSQRDEIILNLKKQNFLQDNIINHFSKNMPKVIYSLFSKSFPEYINLYVNSCINYRTGKLKYEKGNPTVNCDLVVKELKKRNIINERLILKYEQSKLQ